MGTDRLEALGDGVIAIMVLALLVPHGSALADLRPVIPGFLDRPLRPVHYDREPAPTSAGAECRIARSADRTCRVAGERFSV